MVSGPFYERMVIEILREHGVDYREVGISKLFFKYFEQCFSGQH